MTAVVGGEVGRQASSVAGLRTRITELEAGNAVLRGDNDRLRAEVVCLQHVSEQQQVRVHLTARWSWPPGGCPAGSGDRQR